MKSIDKVTCSGSTSEHQVPYSMGKQDPNARHTTMVVKDDGGRARVCYTSA